MCMKTPIIITGHYGSGKTEFAANYALYLQRTADRPIIAADMDIVNPYFRVRELKDFFAAHQIETISSNYDQDYHFDVPALASALQSCFQRDDRICLIDAGGDSVGARVLARYAPYLKMREYAMWMAVNANRLQTQTADAVCRYIQSINEASGLQINGLINTTHMLRETTAEDILKGDRLLREVSGKTGLPVLYTVIEARLLPSCEALNLCAARFPIRLLMRPAWL